MGYHLNEGGFFIGDCQVADWEDIAKAERVSDIPVRRVKMKEVDLELFNGKPRFPIAEGILPQPISLLNADRQRNRSWEPPELQLVNNEEEEIDLDIGLKKTGESLIDDDDEDDVEPTDDLKESGGRIDSPGIGEGVNQGDDQELKDYWSLTRDMLVIHHLKPRLKLFEPTAENIPIPLKYLDILRVTRTDLDTLGEDHIEDIWYRPNQSVGESRELSG